MPAADPPAGLAIAPALRVIPPGTRLWRIHSERTAADEFSASGATVEPGGRFDSPDGGYPSMYVSFHPATAIIERFLRGQRFTSEGTRTLYRKKLAGTVMTPLGTTAELILLRLVFDRDFAVLRQSDEWLVTSGEQDYPRTQRWADWLRARVGRAQGVVWQSTADLPRQTAILFGDRCPPGLLEILPDTSVKLDDAAGARWLTEILQPYRIGVRAPDPVDQPLIFLNYRSGDDTALAVELLDQELTARLGTAPVYRDRRMPPGTYYPADLIEKAKRCRVMLALIGPRWEQRNGQDLLGDENDWVRREIAVALAHGVCVVPVLVGLRTVLSPQGLPEEIRRLADISFLTLSHSYSQRDVVELVDKLFELVPLPGRGA